MNRLLIRLAAFLLAPSIVLAVGCAASPPPTTTYRDAPPVAQPGARPSGAAIGLVLTGGGAFGAWEVGALQALFDAWHWKYGEDPPIVAVAGTSTGAILAPFVLLGRAELAEAANWYTHVTQRDIARPKIGALLPFPLFAITTPSVYGVGYTEHPGSNTSGLYGKLLRTLPPERMARLASMWPHHRIVVATLDFCSGLPHPVTNAPAGAPMLREAILASAMAPLAFPPVPFPRAGDDGCAATTPHLDGGVYSVAPFAELFDVVNQDQPLPLTHIIVVSAFPFFPSDDRHPVQDRQFPRNPKFKAIGDRMNVLLSEAGATAGIRLARAAIALRKSGMAASEVESITGMRVPQSAPMLIEMRPSSRLGWEALNFREQDMTSMYQRGLSEGCAELAARLDVPASCPPPASSLLH